MFIFYKTSLASPFRLITYLIYLFRLYVCLILAVFSESTTCRKLLWFLSSFSFEIAKRWPNCMKETQTVPDLTKQSPFTKTPWLSSALNHHRPEYLLCKLTGIKGLEGNRHKAALPSQRNIHIDGRKSFSAITFIYVNKFI